MNSEGRMEVVRELCSFEGRLAGTDAERRAANRLAARLRGLGRPAEVEPTLVHPRYGLVHAIHCALGIAGSVVAVAAPAVGFALVLAAATSMYLDLHGRVYLVRRLFFRRSSQNVVSPGSSPGAPVELVLCAHYDVARTGAAFAPRPARLAARAAAGSPVALGPFRVLFWSLAALLPLLGARMAGVDSDALAIAQLAPTIALLVGAFALVEIELSPPSPGASDNGSGVAAAISLADELDREPPRGLDVAVLLTGAEECQQEGMRAYLRAHRRELDRSRTVFLCLDTLGAGAPRFEVTAGWAVSFDLDHRLVELGEAIAAADREGERRFEAGPLRSGIAGDSLPPRLRGFRSLGITCRDADGRAPNRHLATDTPDRVDPRALDRVHDFALELVRALDRDAVRKGPPA